MKILFGEGDWQEIPNLQEMNFGIFECHSFEEIEENEEFQKWVYDETDEVCPPDGESRLDFSMRVKEGLRELIGLHRLKEWSHRHGGEDAVTVMVCHGGVISSMMRQMFPGAKSNMWDWIPEPGLGYIVDFRESEPESYTEIGIKKKE